MRIVVLGVGNILLTDEGIGPAALNRLVETYELPPEVVAIDGGTCGMELLDDLGHADHLIMLDAVRAGQPPATVITLVGDQIPVFFKTKLSPHQVGLSDVLATLEITGESPRETTIFGVQPVSFATHMGLSPEVEARVPELVEMVVATLARHGIVLQPKQGS